MSFLDSLPAGVHEYRAPEFGALRAMSLAREYDSPENLAGSIRERALAEATGMAITNPVVRYGVELSIANLIGDSGLTPKPQLNASLLGITTSQADDIAEQFEDIWHSWSSSTEASTSGNETFGQIMSSALRRSFSTGELLLSVDFAKGISRRFATSVKALDTQRIARWGAMQQPPTGSTLLQGVEYHTDTGEITHLHIRQLLKQGGAQQVVVPAGTADRLPVQTPFGRPLLVFGIMDKLGPGVVRGVSPILSAIERAIMSTDIEEASLNALLEQLRIVFSLTSDLSVQEAQAALGDPEAIGDITRGRLRALDEHFKHMPLSMPRKTTVSILPAGSKLTTTQPTLPATSLDVLLRRLYLEVSRGLGLAYSDLTGDYSSDSYSASRLSLTGPWAIVKARRANFVAPICSQIYSAVIEEAIMRGMMVKLPKRAVDFHTARAFWTQAEWRGPSRPSADPKGDAQADALALANNTRTIADICAERGQDWRKVLKQRAAEIALAKELGIPSTAGSEVVVNDTEQLDPPDNENAPAKQKKEAA